MEDKSLYLIFSWKKHELALILAPPLRLERRTVGLEVVFDFVHPGISEGIVSTQSTNGGNIYLLYA